MHKKFGGLTLAMLAALLAVESSALRIEVQAEDGEAEMINDAAD